jgi:seryl-tRNA synthetase
MDRLKKDYNQLLSDKANMEQQITALKVQVQCLKEELLKKSQEAPQIYSPEVEVVKSKKSIQQKKQSKHRIIIFILLDTRICISAQVNVIFPIICRENCKIGEQNRAIIT